MALDEGTITVDPSTGAVSGGGYALELYGLEGGTTDDIAAIIDARAAARLDAAAARPAALWAIRDTAFWSDPANLAAERAKLIAHRTNHAASCTARAATLAAFIRSGTVSAEVPSTPYTITNGTID